VAWLVRAGLLVIDPVIPAALRSELTDEPHTWSFQYSDEELQDYAFKMTFAADALLLGRITYEGMAQAWPTRGGNPFADHVNSTKKYVVASQPINTTAWDPTVVIAAPTCSARSAD
jgi:dihydrofolate reductase